MWSGEATCLGAAVMPLVDLSDDETARNFTMRFARSRHRSPGRGATPRPLTGSIDDDHLYDVQISSQQAGRTRRSTVTPAPLPAEGLDEMSNIKLVRDIASKRLNNRDGPYPWNIPVSLALQIIKALHRQLRSGMHTRATSQYPGSAEVDRHGA